MIEIKDCGDCEFEMNDIKDEPCATCYQRMHGNGVNNFKPKKQESDLLNDGEPIIHNRVIYKTIKKRYQLCEVVLHGIERTIKQYIPVGQEIEL